ncbi:hypothetical protein LguiB_027055 [Lonicera macranthoides]
MTTTGRLESINAFIKRFISSHTNLGEFVKQVDIAIEDIEQVQLHDTMLETYRGSSLRTMSSLEEQAHDVLTPYCFKKFQEQFGKATLFSLIHEDGYMFVLKYYEDTCYNKRHNVFWDGEMAICSCKYFEFWGILCWHILSVFLRKDCYKIPSHYLQSRWCHQALQIDQDRFQVLEEEQIRSQSVCDSQTELKNSVILWRVILCELVRTILIGGIYAQKVETSYTRRSSFCDMSLRKVCSHIHFSPKLNVVFVYCAENAMFS